MNLNSKGAHSRCACGKANFSTRKQARRHGSKFPHDQHRGTYLCELSGYWHLGRYTDVRKFGAAAAGDRVATKQQLRALASGFDRWVYGLVEDELGFEPRLHDVGVHVALLIAEAERREDRAVTVREVADLLPADYLDLVSEPDEEWDGDAAGWLREVCSATVIELAIRGVITVGLDDGVARIGPGFRALLDAADA